jgi:hypothetical protein
MTLTLMDKISLVSFLIALISICLNIVQFFRKRYLKQEFQAYLNGSYVIDFMIARSCSRMRKRYAEKYSAEDLLHHFWCETQSITGFADAARANAVSVAEAHLGFSPKFRHPAFPGETPDDAIALGQSPEKTRFVLTKIDEYLHESLREAPASPRASDAGNTLPSAINTSEAPE